jgi:hypothetical protein
MIDKALSFIEQKLEEGLRVLVNCNRGESRSCGIVLLYIVSRCLKDIPALTGNLTLEQVEKEFVKTYPKYNPSAGMRGFIRENWKEYAS